MHSRAEYYYQSLKYENKLLLKQKDGALAIQLLSISTLEIQTKLSTITPFPACLPQQFLQL
jgi:hypothetical protein